MLWVGQSGVAGRKSKELGVKLVDGVEEWRGIDVARQACNVVGYPGGVYLLGAQGRDRLHTLSQVLPVLFEIVGAWKAAAHADDGDRLKLRGPGGAVAAAHGVVLAPLRLRGGAAGRAAGVAMTRSGTSTRGSPGRVI